MQRTGLLLRLNGSQRRNSPTIRVNSLAPSAFGGLIVLLIKNQSKKQPTHSSCVHRVFKMRINSYPPVSLVPGFIIQVYRTQAIQADLRLSRIEGMVTPILVPRQGYCAYTCNICGQNCPVQAIPMLSLEEKRVTKIGTADVETKRAALRGGCWKLYCL